MKKVFSVFVLTFIVGILNGQHFVDNLFVRYQWSELRKYQRLGLNNPPLRCIANSTAKALWLKSEQQLSKHSMTLLQQNRWDEEIIFFKSCIKADSLFCDAYFRLAQCLVERTDWVGVLNLLNLAQRKFPNDPMVYMGLGQALLYLQFPNQALKNFEKLIALLPSSAEGYLGASMVSYDIGEPQKALDFLHKGYVKVEGDIQYLKLFEAILLYHTNQTRQAYNLLTSLESPSFNYTSYATSVTFNHGNFEPELDGIREYYLALCYAARGEEFYTKAANHLKIAKRNRIVVDTTLAKVLGLSVTVDDLKEQLLSSYHLESVSDKKKSDPAADEAFENRRIDKATTLFSQRVNQDSLNLYSYFRLAECYQSKAEPQGALAAYKIAAKEFPKDDRVKMRLIRQLVRVDSLSSALKITQDLIDKHPGKMETYFQAALLMTMLNKNKEAIKLLKKLELGYVENEQNMPWKIPFMLGELHYLSGDYGVASGYFNFAILQYGSLRDPYLNYYHAKCLGAKGQEADAKKYFYDAMNLGAIIDKDTLKKFQLVEKQSTPYGEKY